MKKYIDLQRYAPIISSKEAGEEIYRQIKECGPKEHEIAIDMREIKSMATYCAQQIFGTLYLELGSELFFKHIIIHNASEDVQLIIKLGIRYAVEKSMNTVAK